jgi:hypothetical protein
LTNFYHVPSCHVGRYILPVSGLLLAGSGWLFVDDLLDAAEQTIVWTVIFFFASAAAGAYLTASKIFPVEIRARAIAFFLRGRHRYWRGGSAVELD